MAHPLEAGERFFEGEAFLFRGSRQHLRRHRAGDHNLATVPVQQYRTILDSVSVL